jgi:hypothetical protein
MRRLGPLHTLLAGLVLALALALFGRAGEPAAESEDEYGYAKRTSAAPLQQPAPEGPAAGTTRSTAAPRQAVATTRLPATYAARASGSRAVVAMTVRGDTAIAYVCDGHRLEAWLHGKVYPHGLVRLQSARGQSASGILTGSIVNGVAVGAVSLSKQSLLAFKAPVVREPAGLYRSSATVRRAKFIGGWIVLPGGGQVGLVAYGEGEEPAPKLDPAKGFVELDGTRVPVVPADPRDPI